MKVNVTIMEKSYHEKIKIEKELNEEISNLGFGLYLGNSCMG